MSSQLGRFQLGDAQLGGGDSSAPGPEIRPTGISSEEAFGDAALYTQAIIVDGIASEEAFGEPTLSGPLEVVGIASLESWGTPTLADFNIRPTGIASDEAFGVLALADRNVRVLGGIASAEGFGIPALLSDEFAELFMDNQLVDYRKSSVRIDKSNGSPYKMVFKFTYKDGVQKPHVNKSIRYYVDGELRYGGLVLEWTDENIPGNYNKSLITVTCTGFAAYADRIVVAKKFTLALGGGVPGIMMYLLWQTKLQPTFGTTKYNNNDDGPSVDVGEMTFAYLLLSECFNQITDKTPGWNWWIDDYNSFHYENTLGISANAPFSITDGSRNVDKITVTETARKYRNRQWVKPSADLNGLLEEPHTGDGNTQGFPTDYALDAAPLISVNGSQKNVFAFGSGPWPDDWEWYYIPGGIGVFARQAPATGAVIDVRYPNPFPIAFSRENTPGIAANGLWESVYQSQNITTEVDAESAAQGLVDLYSDPDTVEYPSVVNYEYNSEHQPLWLTPGMVIPVNRTFPDVVGNFIVDSVSSVEYDEVLFRHTVVLRNQAGDVDENRFVSDLLAISRTQAVSKVIPATLELDINGFGLETGFLPNRFVVQQDGVISSWDALFAVSPPLGDDIHIDCFLNGTSIFASGDDDKIFVPAGTSTLVTGYAFNAANIPVKKGDIISFRVLQVGSSSPGRYGVVHVNMKV